MSEDFIPRQEGDRVHRRAIWLTAGVALLVLFVGLFAADGILRARTRPRIARGAQLPPPVAPATIGVVEQSLIETTRRGLDLENAQRERLDRYEWVDRDRGIARIPIERAMDLVA